MREGEDLRLEEFLRLAGEYWEGRGGRMTVVRRILCRVLFESGESIDAETLLRLGREADNLISLSTVYRTLEGLVEAGLLVEVGGRDGRTNYSLADRSTNAASHIVCADCGQVLALESPCLALREGASARAAGFSPTRIQLRLEGHCDTFRRTGSCSVGKVGEVSGDMSGAQSDCAGRH